MIEHGDYFHRETLTLVRTTTIATRYWEPGNVPFKVSGYLVGITRRVWVQEPYDKFCEEYVRNVPVTRELLGQMGFFDGRVRLSDSRRGTMRLDFATSPASLDYEGTDENGYHEFPAPTTLRDLMNVLRVLGVEAPAITPAETITQPS